MISAIVMILVVAACFLAAVLNLAVNTRFRSEMTRVAIILAVAIGSFFYGYGYATCYGIHVTSVIRALLALCRMFGGVNDLGSVQAAPLFQYPAALTVFWLGHFMAFYVTASAAIATLGDRLLRRIRASLLRRGPLLLIYGINARSVAFGRRQVQKKHRAVVYTDKDCSQDYESSIRAFGAVVDRSSNALEGNDLFLKQINMKPGKRRLELATMNSDGRKNLAYAQKLLESMTITGIRPEQTSLLAVGVGEDAAVLQALKGKGYGSVFAFDDYELTARQMVRAHSPCDLIRFDEHGRAKDDFQVVILGFGRMGRAVLSQLVMNGQFYGSHFRADIFDPNAQNGYLHEHPMSRAYDLQFHRADGRGDVFYAFLEEYMHRIKMIVICTGAEEMNREMEKDIVSWFPRDEKIPMILQATRDGYSWTDQDRHEQQNVSLFEDDDLETETMDAMAMQVNQIYCVEMGSTQTAQENWRECSYFNRQSSRACADFYPALLRAAGKTADQVLAGDWPPQGELLENLAQTEHLRWCAFHYVNGYAPMPAETWSQRAEAYRQGEKIRISKDEEKRLQACLIPWEELDVLSKRENAVTGGHMDYKQTDRNNIILLRRVIAAQRQTEKDKAHE